MVSRSISRRIRQAAPKEDRRIASRRVVVHIERAPEPMAPGGEAQVLQTERIAALADMTAATRRARAAMDRKTAHHQRVEREALDTIENKDRRLGQRIRMVARKGDRVERRPHLPMGSRRLTRR